MNDLVLAHNNQAVVSSRVVAEKFGKQHRDVMRSIREIVSAQNCALAFYEEHQYKVKGQYRSYPEYYMNRDGFMLLVMGFTTKPAMQVKIAFIKAFNEMEAKLKEKSEVPNEKLIAAYNENIKQLAKRNNELERKLKTSANFLKMGFVAYAMAKDPYITDLSFALVQGFTQNK